MTSKAINLWPGPRLRRRLCGLHARAAWLFLTLGAQVALAQSGSYDWTLAGVPLHASYPGILRAYVATNRPRLMKINCLRIDMKEPTLRLFTTGRMIDWADGARETMTQRTRDFITESQSGDHKVVAAINASPWNMTNAFASVPANLIGLAVSRGTLVSALENNFPSFIVSTNGVPSIIRRASTPDVNAVQTAVTGFGRVLNNGAPSGNTSTLHPRTGIGVSADAQYVFFMTVDGRAFQWSAGATEYEIGAWLKHFGAHNGINMDGGGSTTMAWLDPSSGTAQLLNVPRNSDGFGSPPSAQERYIGNNIGVTYVARPGKFGQEE